MDQNLLPDIFAFLEQNCPELVTPECVFLGGSQVIDGGIHKTSDSDYDIVLLFPHIDYPSSYTFQSDDGRRTYDIIVRDIPSLAHDIDLATSNGKGTILHLCAYGKVLFDPNNKAQSLQDTLKSVYQTGPLTLNHQDFKSGHYTLQNNFLDLPEGPAQQAGILTISNMVAQTALRLSGHWTSSGKIAGRFLQAALPRFAEDLQSAYEAALSKGDKAFIYRLINHDLPRLYFLSPPNGNQYSKPNVIPDFRKSPTDFADAITASRVNLNALAHYLKSLETIANQAAIAWANIKLNTVSKPLTTEKFQTKPMEYFLSLGRAISSVADIEYAKAHDFPTNVTEVQRITALFNQNTAYESAMKKAIQGDSSALKQLFCECLSGLGDSLLPFSYRPSPPIHNPNPLILKALSHI